MEEANWSREYDPEETLLAYESFEDKKINQLTEFELSLISKRLRCKACKGNKRSIGLKSSPTAGSNSAMQSVWRRN